MSQKHVEQRLRLNRRLAEQDAANRCPVCKRALPRVGVVMVWGDPRMWCSTACRDEAKERIAMTARGRKKLAREQFNRACEIRMFLNRLVATFDGEDRPRLHAERATSVLVSWLQQEYRFGRRAALRERMKVTR